jgi:hypothetical protein
MKRTILPFLLLVAFVTLPQAKAASDLPRVTRPTMIEVENSMDTTVSLSRTENPFLLSGITRGVYLEGYGAVFTAEVNLVAISAAQMMFKPALGKAEVAQHRQKKLARLPELKKAIQTAMVDAAVGLKTLPDDERIVFVALLAKYPWEDLTGVPLQIMMQSTRKQLLAAKGNSTAMDAAIRVTEN